MVPKFPDKMATSYNSMDSHPSSGAVEMKLPDNDTSKSIETEFYSSGMGLTFCQHQRSWSDISCVIFFQQLLFFFICI